MQHRKASGERPKKGFETGFSENAANARVRERVMIPNAFARCGN
ncbi:hypothetical protein PAMC26510_06370 [Caballeronia sordidicola]|uniref:Uncharacterized protein n=1 Tax=Caballeronia sordidicola TaxID=196367 RepID=A0A242N676_CABSO|nr:hypothetical protein PAMC26510_06370 [Caballeronia sordidicola]